MTRTTSPTQKLLCWMTERPVSPSSQLCLLRVVKEDTCCSTKQEELTLAPVPASGTSKWSGQGPLVTKTALGGQPEPQGTQTQRVTASRPKASLGCVKAKKACFQCTHLLTTQAAWKMW